MERNEKVELHDSFTLLAAIASNTRRIRIGTTVTPLPRLRPWTVARQTATLDHLSNGRLVLGVGLGTEESCDYGKFGESPENKVLAEKLDESLDIITGLWTGKTFSYMGRHYKMGKTTFLPPPKQKPRIPIWVGGFWPRKGPFKRAARWDGVIPLRLPVALPKPEDLREVIAYIRKLRSNKQRFDVIKIGWSTGIDASMKAKVRLFVEAGATWWLESLYRMDPERMRKRVRLGPPKIS